MGFVSCITKWTGPGEVRQCEERIDALTPSLEAKTAKASTSVEDAPPPQPML